MPSIASPCLVAEVQNSVGHRHEQSDEVASEETRALARDVLESAGVTSMTFNVQEDGTLEHGKRNCSVYSVCML